MPCELRLRDDMSANAVARIARLHDTMHTPHVGNWTTARLVIPTLGVTAVCVDHTMANATSTRIRTCLFKVAARISCAILLTDSRRTARSVGW